MRSFYQRTGQVCRSAAALLAVSASCWPKRLLQQQARMGKSFQDGTDGKFFCNNTKYPYRVPS